ncbi:LysR family transcriptional regulator [Sphingomonas sp. dw_22]|uniref:LysR family transcriptional regulator n=1 Tax=Sphingomonas sp. dw_22 TaxID=2721175 RepID=UPI001BD6AC31|nr:LysR family transcriptional regulator [Sphingomonas sp. dw_22]
MDQLLAMKAFCRVVETGGFTSAADALDMPKATVSKIVGELEGHLRVRLLNRTTRSVQVTKEGAIYYERASAWLQQLPDIDSVFDGERVKPRGRLAVHTSSWVASEVLIPALPQFQAEYPEIEIEIGVSDRSVHMIREGADCAIRGGELSDQTIISRLLGSSPWLTAAGPDYLERHGIPRHPDELTDGHALIHYRLARTGRPTAFRFERGEDRVTITGRSILSVNESNAHLAAGIAGLGVLQSFEWKLRPAIKEGRLVPILTEWVRPNHPFHVLYPSNRYMNTRLRVFIDWLVKVFAEIYRPERTA